MRPDGFNRTNGWLILLVAALAGGCSDKPKSMPQYGLYPTNLREITREAQAVAEGGGPKDPAPHMSLVVYLDIYQLDVPLGTISRNDAFWKGANEHCVDVATSDLLYKNGIRVGQARIDEWDYFKKIIDENPTRVQPHTVTASQGAAIELEVKKDIAEQTIACWDGAGEPTMRTYDQSTNVLSLTFMPTPRSKVGSVRVALCPTVRATRKHWVVTSLNRDQEAVEYTAPERFYELNMCTDVPPDMFLIVAPSREARWKMSLGQAFFVRDGAAEQFEQILLIVPRPYRVEEKAR